MYDCLSDLPTDKLEVPHLSNALTPYFMHESTIVQVSARNAAQFLIPNLGEKKKKCFILSSKNIQDFINASGKDMPIISSLQLFLAYGQLVTNSVRFLKEGLVIYLLSVMFNQSSRNEEKIMAVSVVKMLSLHYQSSPKLDSSVVQSSATDVKVAVKPEPGGVVKISPKVLEALDHPHILCQLDKQAKSFIATCSRTMIDHSSLKESFESFSHLLKILEKECIASHDREILMSSNVSNMLLNATIDLLEGKLL